MLNREIYVDETGDGFILSAYITVEGNRYIDHVYEGDHLETLIEDFKIDNPEYKDIGVSRV